MRSPPWLSLGAVLCAGVLAGPACGGSPPRTSPAAGAAGAGPATSPDSAWEGTHVLTQVLERGQPTRAAPEEFHISLQLNGDGTYAMKEWEHGRWDRQAAGAYQRAGSELRLMQVEPGVDLILHARASGGVFQVCWSASEESGAGTGALVGKHTMVEKTSGGHEVNEGSTTQVALDDKGMAQVNTGDGKVILTGRYRTEADRLIIEGGEGNRVELIHWFDDGRLLLCRDALESRAGSGAR